MTPSEIKKLNEKLDEFQDKPRNLSEPKLKYIPAPDLRPETIEQLTPRTKLSLKQ